MRNKYDFKGIKKVGAAGILAALTVWAGKFGLAGFIQNKIVKLILKFFIERYVNGLANRSLFVLNLGHIKFDTEGDQKAFEGAYIAGNLKVADLIREKGFLTKEDMVAIDDEVIANYDKWAVFGKLRKR